MPEAEASRSGTDFFFDEEKGSRGGRRADRRAGRDAGRGRRGSRAAARGHGRRARRGKGRRITVLALVLGSGLAVLTVAELGAPGMPWQEPVSAVSGPPGGEKATDESAGAKKRKAAPEDGSPSATRTSETARPSSEPPEKDRPAPAPATVRPTTHAPAPAPTQPRPPSDDPPPKTCFLLWCRN